MRHTPQPVLSSKLLGLLRALAPALILLTLSAPVTAQTPAKPAAPAAKAAPAAVAATPAVTPEVARGEYLMKAGGCLGCHTAEKKDAVPFAGGRGLKTPFGTFYGPNITPHPTAGIGGWTEAQFIRAMRHGERPDGSNYFPAFPFPSFTKINDADLRDLWAYLRSLPPSAQPSLAHELKFPFGFRFPVTIWKWLFFTPGVFTDNAQATPVINRGAYLVQALGHCGECHTPRNLMGGPNKDRFLAGGKGPEGKSVANLTPTGLKKWNDKDLQEFLLSGLSPDGDVTAEAMGEVVTNTTSKLTPPDLAALIAYLRTLAPLPNEAK
jgi:mono/diheme cytochrome c family protein